MNFDKLYKSLVMSGTLLVSSCATPGAVGTSDSPAPTEPKPVTQTTVAEPEEPLDCKSLCSDLGDDNAVCPDPKDGVENCCWLMAKKHPCCSAPGEASADET
jgi:hypothetical protein